MQDDNSGINFTKASMPTYVNPVAAGNASTSDESPASHVPVTDTDDLEAINPTVVVDPDSLVPPNATSN